MNRTNLLQAVTAVSASGAEYVRLEPGFVEACSREIRMRSECEWGGDTATMPLGSFKAALQYCQSDDVEITIGSSVAVSAKRYRRDIPIIPESWVYSKTGEIPTKSFRVNADKLAAAIKACLLGTNSMFSRYELERIQVSTGAVFGTNGSLMVLSTLEMFSGHDGINLSIPLKLAGIIADLQGGDIEVTYSDNMVRFRYGPNDWIEGVLHSTNKDMVSVFTNVMVAFELAEKATAELSSSAFANAVSAANSVNQSKVIIQIGADGLDVCATGESSASTFSTNLHCASLSGCKKINVNPSYLSRAIRACGSETLKVQIGEQLLLSAGNVKAMICGIR